MLLGASGEANGLDVDLSVAMDATKSGDAGVPNGEPLLAFASAMNRRSTDTQQAAAAISTTLGDEAVLEAAATVAIFNGLVRVADGTGIQLDPSMLTSTAATRAELGIEEFAGAANSAAAASAARRSSDNIVQAMFD